MSDAETAIAALQADLLSRTRRRALPEPLLVQDTGQRRLLHYAHRANLTRWKPRYGGRTTVACRFPGCGFHGVYPSVEHARAVADEHMIRTHASGAALCGQPHCPGCAAIKRKIRRLT